MSQMYSFTWFRKLSLNDMIIRFPYIIVSQKGTSSLILRGWMAEYISYTQALLAGQISIKDANYIHTYLHGI